MLFIITDISNSRKKILPPYLFEKILLKSREIKWFIQLDNLRKLLPYRDVLNWKNIELLTFFRFKKCLDESILGQMSQVIYPLKSLSIFVDDFTDEGLKSLCSMGSTLESLELYYAYRLYKIYIYVKYFIIKE